MRAVLVAVTVAAVLAIAVWMVRLQVLDYRGMRSSSDRTKPLLSLGA